MTKHEIFIQWLKIILFISGAIYLHIKVNQIVYLLRQINNALQ